MGQMEGKVSCNIVWGLVQPYHLLEQDVNSAPCQQRNPTPPKDTVIVYVHSSHGSEAELG